MEKEFNHVEITETDGIGEIKIDGIELKGITGYELKRDAEVIEIIIKLKMPARSLKTIY